MDKYSGEVRDDAKPAASERAHIEFVGQSSKRTPVRRGKSGNRFFDGWTYTSGSHIAGALQRREGIPGDYCIGHIDEWGDAASALSPSRAPVPPARLRNILIPCSSKYRSVAFRLPFHLPESSMINSPPVTRRGN